MNAPFRDLAPPAALPVRERLSPVGLALLLSVSVIWGVNWPIFKVALNGLDPWTFRTMSVLGSGGVLTGMAIAGGHAWRVPRRRWGPLVLLALTNITLWMMLSTFGVRILASGHAVLLNYTMPLWAVLLGAWLLGERLSGRRVAALALGLASILVLASGGFGRMAEAPLGALLVLLAALAFGFATVFAKRYDWGVAPVALAGWQMLVGGVPIVAVAAAFGFQDLAEVPAASLAAAAYSIVIGGVFGFWAWQKAVLLLPAAVAGIGSLLIPVVGVAAGAVMLGEPLEWRELVALSALLAAVSLVLFGPQPPRQAREP